MTTAHNLTGLPITMQQNRAAMINSHNRDKAWAVYQIVDAAGEIAFIGACKADRVYSLPDARRNTEFLSRFETTGEYYGIVIIEYTAERIDAARNAINYIRQVRPWCNMKGIVRSIGKMIECIETGRRWPTMSAACKELNVSQPQMSMHINRKTGYASVQGYTYRQVMETGEDTL